MRQKLICYSSHAGSSASNPTAAPAPSCGRGATTRESWVPARRPRREQRFAADSTVDYPDHVLIPGLVNAHVHAGMNLLRGFADDLPLMRWLSEAIWPAEAEHASAAFVRDTSLLAATEMLAPGRHHHLQRHVLLPGRGGMEAFDRVGMRAMIGMVVIEFPTAYAFRTGRLTSLGLAIPRRLEGVTTGFGSSASPSRPIYRKGARRDKPGKNIEPCR